MGVSRPGPPAHLQSSSYRVLIVSYYSFTNEYGETYGSCEVFRWDRFDCMEAGLIERDPESPTGWVSFDFGMGGTLRIEANPADWEGWYWQACFPGCLPDGDPMGPFETESDAMSDANCI